MEFYGETFDDPEEEFTLWRKHYAQQFDIEEDPEIVDIHERIDAVILFENLLRQPDLRSVELLNKAAKALQEAGALNPPLPTLPWEEGAHLNHPNSQPAAHDEPQIVSTQTESPILVNSAIQTTPPMEATVNIITETLQIQDAPTKTSKVKPLRDKFLGRCLLICSFPKRAILRCRNRATRRGE